MADTGDGTRFSKGNIALLLGDLLDAEPMEFELNLYRCHDGAYQCAVAGCPIRGTANNMINIGPFVLCRSDGDTIQRNAARIHGRQVAVFKLEKTLVNIKGHENEGRVREAREWFERRQARLAELKATHAPKPVPTPAPAMPPALVAAAAVIALPVPAPRASAPIITMATTVNPNDEMAKLQRQLTKLDLEAADPDSAFTLAEIAAKEYNIKKRLIALGISDLTTVVSETLPVLSAPVPVVVPATPVVAAPVAPVPVATPAPELPVASAWTPAPVTTIAPAPAVPNAHLMLEVRVGDKPLPRQELKRRADPGPVQVVCSASGGTRQGDPIALARSVELFNPEDYQRVENCFAKLGDLKRKIFDHIYPHAEQDADNAKLRDFRSAEFKAARKATFPPKCLLCGKKLEALEGLRKAVIEFGKAIWPDKWEGRKDESNGDVAHQHFKCADHPKQDLFGLLFDRATGAPRAEVGPDNVCGKCHRRHKNEITRIAREANAGARSAEDAALRLSMRGASGGGKKGKKGGGGKKGGKR